MPRPSESANNSRTASVARISAATGAAGVPSQAAALDRAANRLSAAEIFLIGGIILDQHAAIDVERHAGDHARRATGQKQNGVGDVLGLAHPAQRDLERARSPALVG